MNLKNTQKEIYVAPIKKSAPKQHTQTVSAKKDTKVITSTKSNDDEWESF